MGFDFDSDYAGSDDMEQILKMSLDHTSKPTRPLSVPPPPESFHSHKPGLKARLASIDLEISRVDSGITEMQTLRARLAEERAVILDEIQGSHRTQANVNGRGKGKSTGFTLDYMNETFEWSGELKSRMRKIFGIKEFRFCQQGVCNANLDGRDIVCVMPTGGGKSLTYQLPALLSPGCTLVISPLIALMTDQVMHLYEANVGAVMLCSSTSSAESKNIFSRLQNPPSNPQEGIKLCYVTPERIASSKSFLSLLTKMVDAGLLARIVIDEAHCVSSMGHDFRPDYMQLSKLRTLFPSIPILALSATCPPKVLGDLLKILQLKEVTTGLEAEEGKTVYFSSPLYRKNLHYSVRPKPATDKGIIKAISDYILEHHADHSGIVYCFTKQDTQKVADGLQAASDGKIKTGVYHADVHDHEKNELHEKWRKGKIKVVCATIAFGLGIDKGDVRFVLHHSMSKSIEGYYQESGRAGRDGKDADCILFYRPQDASRLGGYCMKGAEKFLEMLRYTQDLEQCRKVLFAKYFSASSNLSLSSWTTDASDALAHCGHCDNCIRPPDTFVRKDVTLEAWQVLKVAQEVKRIDTRVTLRLLGELARGGGSIDIVDHGKRGRLNSKEKVKLDVNTISGGKVELSGEDVETLIVDLLYKGYLSEEFVSGAYKTTVYMKPAISANRLTLFSRKEVEDGKGARIMCSFSVKTRRSSKRSKATKREEDTKSSSAFKTKPVRQMAASGSGKRTHAEVDISDEELGDDLYADDSFTTSDEEPDDHAIGGILRSSKSTRSPIDVSDHEGYDWTPSLRYDPRPKKKSRTSENDIIEVSD